MKHKLILMLIGLLMVAPSLVNGYNPTNEELRGLLFDYIGTQSQRQQYQDILNTQNNSYQQLFNSYNQSTSNLDRELELKLKELELQKNAAERAGLWEKEKQIIDQQLELIRQTNKLEEERKAFELEKNSQDLIKFGEETAGQIKRERELKEKPNGLPAYSPAVSGSSEIDDLLKSFQNVAPSVQPAVTTPIEPPAPRKNIFYRFWKSFTSLF